MNSKEFVFLSLIVISLLIFFLTALYFSCGTLERKCLEYYSQSHESQMLETCLKSAKESRNE